MIIIEHVLNINKTCIWLWQNMYLIMIKHVFDYYKMLLDYYKICIWLVQKTYLIITKHYLIIAKYDINNIIMWLRALSKSGLTPKGTGLNLILKCVIWTWPRGAQVRIIAFWVPVILLHYKSQVGDYLTYSMLWATKLYY